MTVTIRVATDEDIAFLSRLLGHPDVQPFLAASRTGSEEEIRRDLERSRTEPDETGVVVLELDAEPVGTARWQLVNRRSRIASIGAFVIDPALRGRRVGVEAARALQRHLVRELGFHRLQMEIYAFNERALRHAERAGWIREGVRRRAYWYEGAWVDGVLFGLVEEDLEP